ncbi:MAG: alpha/beta fold hydrolase [Candidatus Hodarchaeota archaeon]
MELNGGIKITEHWNHDYMTINNVKIHYVVKGSGDPLLLLHGFPDFWYSWKYQIPAFSDYFQVFAPDLRGYNKSDKPKGVNNYSTTLLVQDIKDFINAIGEQKAIIIGHDWGGAVAWNLAMMAPECVSKLIILNCPHPIPLLEAFWSMKFQQLQKSWYVFFFQIPDVPEVILSRNNCEFLVRMLKGSIINKQALNSEDLQRYIEAWSQPGALTASINYYRANWNPAQLMTMTEEQQNNLIRRFPKVKCPTLVLWGEKDVALDKLLTQGMQKYFDGSFKITYLPDFGHWVHIEAPDLVNKSILSFLGCV